MTVNKKWFDDDLTEFEGEQGPNSRQQFEERAKAWLLENVLAEFAGTPKADEFFRLFSETTTLANAKRIANHPDYPDIVRDEIAQRIDENRFARGHENTTNSGPGKTSHAGEGWRARSHATRTERGRVNSAPFLVLIGRALARP
ncbi:MAG: hypothetical protein EP320_15970 [Rhodobacteraceae bacterium]|nr:MAG: hypothetical protein EP320_15970 [Paracoccaceae bacterium]